MTAVEAKPLSLHHEMLSALIELHRYITDDDWRCEQDELARVHTDGNVNMYELVTDRATAAIKRALREGAPQGKPATTRDLIAELLELRLQVADHNRELAARVLSARTLRATLEQEHACGNKSEAEKRAKADERYLDHERATALVVHARDERLARAESAFLEIAAQLRLDAALLSPVIPPEDA
jgi:hypothetical protein